MGFEQRERTSVASVWWERVPQLGSRAAESSAPRGAEAGEEHSEVNRGRGPEGTGWVVIWKRSDG